MLELVLLGELAICSLWLLKGTVSSKSTGSLVCTESAHEEERAAILVWRFKDYWPSEI